MFEDKFKLVNGVLRMKDDSNIKIGIDGKGYQYVCISDRAVFVHRVVFYLHYGYLPDYIDHIDRNKLNNQPSNLRECNITQNNRNVGIRADNTSGYKGVTWNKSAGKWHAQIKVNGKRKYLGLYLNPIDAAIAYDKAAVDFHGEFALTNKMMCRY